MLRTAVLAALVTLAVSLLPSLALGAPYTIRNDDFTGSATGTVGVVQLSVGESYAVRFTPPDWAGPVTLDRIQFLMTNVGGTCCGLFWLRIYDDPDDGDTDPGELLLDSETVDYPFEIPGNDAGLQEIRMSTLPMSAPTVSGPFRVELHVAARECLSVFPTCLPVLYVDSEAQSGVNFLFGRVGTDLIRTWFDGTDVQGQAAISGDFVMRVVVQTTNNPPQGDVVQPDRDVQQTEPDIHEPPQDTGRVDTGGAVDTWVDETATPVVDVHERDLGGMPDLGEGGDAALAGLRVDQILPESADNDADSEVQILGAGFALGVKVFLDATELVVSEVGPNALLAFVPAGLRPGLKTLVVRNPDGAVVTLPDAFEVTAPIGGDTVRSGGSSCGVGGSPSGGLLLLLALLGVLWERRARLARADVSRHRAV